MAFAILAGILGVGLLLVFACIGIYNRLIQLRNGFKNAFSQIDVQLKRRYDLIPNLVETAKGYLSHERQTLEAVIAARNQAIAANQAIKSGSPEAIQALSSAESVLSSSLARLMVVSESYPDLKGNQNMQRLSEELTGTENRISFARQAYNDAVTEYNNQREVFPNSLIAGAFGFGLAQTFEVTAPEEKSTVRVSFGHEGSR